MTQCHIRKLYYDQMHHYGDKQLRMSLIHLRTMTRGQLSRSLVDVSQSDASGSLRESLILMDRSGDIRQD